MDALNIVLIVLAALAVLLFAGGYVANRRRYRAEDGALRRQIGEADHALAQAHAEDKGWDRPTMEAAAREALGGGAEDLQLVAVLDRPGTDADEAIFRARAGGAVREVRLGRREGRWVAAP